jgi:manganese transport protein
MKNAAGTPSLPEVHRSVPVPWRGSWLRRLFAFAGPAYLVSVGYMDPGNWATDLAGGSRYGYQLIWVLLMSNLMAVLLQSLSARLGVVTGKDLAQACRDFYPQYLVIPLWILCEVAIVACDLAEVLGSAIAMKLLFGFPLLWGVFITSLDVLLLLGLSRLGMRRMEAFIVALVATVGVCFGIEILRAHPDFAEIFKHFIPRDEAGQVSFLAHAPDGAASILGLHGQSLYIAIGILGATVMPHNLYLHSSLVQSRDVDSSREGKRQACRMNVIDSAVALNCAFFVNAAILVLAGTVFYTSGNRGVESIEDAHRLLAPLLGQAAPVIFAIALLCSGQSSTITGTLAGQIVMEGFLRIRIRPWLRRLISRSLAIVPAALVIVFMGEGAVDNLLILSQVVLSLQLSFAVVPLITFTSDRRRMGEFVNPRWVVALSMAVGATILVLDGILTYDQMLKWFQAAGERVVWLWVLLVPVVVALGGLLACLVLAPILERIAPRLMRRRAELEPAVVAASPVVLEAGRRPAPGYRRIAVALEMGPADAAVIDHVSRLVSAPETELVLIHVAESAASRYLGEQSLDKESREDQAALEALAEEFRKRGVGVQVMLGYGDAKAELARLVIESKADILVTGSHGHRLFQDILRGATASAVRHLVQIPVLTVPSR